MIEHWNKLIWEAAGSPALVYSGVRKVSKGILFEFPYGVFLKPELHYRDLCYSEKGKGRQLARNYWNPEAVEAGMEKLLSRRDKPHSSVTIPLQGERKDSRSQGFCMVGLVLTTTLDSVHVDIFYRSTELIQKFAADLVFFSEQLPPLFQELGLQPQTVDFHFANVYLSAMFLPIFLRYEKNPVKFFKYLKQRDPKFFRTVALNTIKYFQEEHNYTYRKRVKLFDYWKENLDESKLITLKGWLENELS